MVPDPSEIRRSAGFPDPPSARVVFTAHSLPARVVAESDRYPQTLAATAALDPSLTTITS